MLYNNYNQSQFLVGDIIFGHHSNGAYGYWTHCAIYLGNGMCSQQSLTDGMFVTRTYEFKYYYNEVRIFRADITQQQRESIVNFVESKNGSIFDMAARKSDRRLWTCAKLCWAAYKEIGIDLSPDGAYVLPDFLKCSKDIVEIAVFAYE